MTKKSLYITWACLYALTVGLGFIPAPADGLYWLLFILSLVFFLPGAMLLRQAIQNKDAQALSRLQAISLCSLGATLIVTVLNVLCYSASAAVGNFMYILLILVSAPMICGRIWVVSMFLWACLLLTAASQLRKLKKKAK